MVHQKRFKEDRLCSNVARLFGIWWFISSQTVGKHEPSAVITFSLRRLKFNIVTFGGQTKRCPPTDQHELRMSGSALFFLTPHQQVLSTNFWSSDTNKLKKPQRQSAQTYTCSPTPQELPQSLSCETGGVPLSSPQIPNKHVLKPLKI